MPEEVDYLVCMDCESPCYVFELDRKQRVVSAYCQVCGNDEASQFRVPEVDEVEVDS
jgi:hypothetical protein